MDENTTPRLTVAEVQTEAEDILIAGSDTTATTLTYACVHLARKPDLWEKLYQEIKPVYGDTGTIRESKVLEPLALLTACIKESKLELWLERFLIALVKNNKFSGLRLAAPVPSYLWRSVPHEGYTIDLSDKTVVLPAGTSVGMSAAIQNYDKDIFPAPDTFNPGRWLGPDNTSSGPNGDLDRYMVSFSKGTRQCGGINLAWMELYMALSTIVMRFIPKGEVEKEKELVQKDQFVGILQVNTFTWRWKIFLHFPHRLTVGLEQRIWYFLRASPRSVNAWVEFFCEEAAFRKRFANEAIVWHAVRQKVRRSLHHIHLYTYGG